MIFFLTHFVKINPKIQISIWKQLQRKGSKTLLLTWWVHHYKSQNTMKCKWEIKKTQTHTLPQQGRMYPLSNQLTECCMSSDLVYLSQSSVWRKSASNIVSTEGRTIMTKENIFSSPNVISGLAQKNIYFKKWFLYSSFSLKDYVMFWCRL